MSVGTTTIFPLLHDPDTYRRCECDLLVDDAARAYWLGVFEKAMPFLLQSAVEGGLDPAIAAACAVDWKDEIDRARRDPAALGRLDVIRLVELRHEVSERHGVRDEFRHIKERENRSAIEALPERLAHLDRLDPDARWIEAARGLLAGNLFDLGAEGLAREYSDATVPFQASLDRVPPRPWFRDDLDELIDSLHRMPPRRAIIFVDNAGPDIMLGLLPFARELLRLDSEVVLAANAGPSLNDVTHDELVDLVTHATRVDEVFGRDTVQLVSHGQTAPLVDLAAVAPEFAAVACDADLVMLHGMGRSMESNADARFTCRSIKVGMMKDRWLAKRWGAKWLDAVLRFEGPATGRP